MSGAVSHKIDAGGDSTEYIVRVELQATLARRIAELFRSFFPGPNVECPFPSYTDPPELETSSDVVAAGSLSKKEFVLLLG